MSLTDDISDGYHTFGELYQHRRALTAALVKLMPEASWRSRQHSEGDSLIFRGYFIVGIDLPQGTITYHYKLDYWDDFAAARELDRAPAWDGARSEATVDRLLEFVKEGN